MKLPRAIAGLILLAAAAALACGAGDNVPGPALDARSAPAADAPPPPGTGVPAQTARQPLIVFLGDSLTAGLGVPADAAYPAIIGTRLAAEGTPVRIVNAGVSGDTSAGGVRRLDWVLGQKPDILAVELGANDALRGQSVEDLETNLRVIIERGQAQGARILLLGMRIPTNYGPDYTESFAAVYPRVARDLRIPLVPFLLDGVGGHPDLNIPDGLHPNERGHRIVAENVLPELRKVIRSLPRTTATPPR